jgi:hypothetical protein
MFSALLPEPDDWWTGAMAAKGFAAVPILTLPPSRCATSPGGSAWSAMFSALLPASDDGWTGAMEGKGFVGVETGAVVESGNDLGAESAGMGSAA